MRVIGELVQYSALDQTWELGTTLFVYDSMAL